MSDTDNASSAPASEAAAAGPACLLSYIVATAPSPLIAGEPGTVYISIVPASPKPKVACESITFQVPCSTDPPPPTGQDQPPPLFASTPSANVEAGDNWDATTGDTPGYVTFENRTPSAPVGGSIFFSLSGTIAAAVGGAACQVTESAGTIPAPSSPATPITYTERFAQIAVAKAPVQLYLANFYASLAQGDNTPVTSVTAGTPFYLNWESNGSSFTLYGYGPIPPMSNGTTWCSIDSGIFNDTTFMLVAEDQTGAQRLAVVTLTVSNPTLMARQLNMVVDDIGDPAITIPGAGVLDMGSGNIRMTYIGAGGVEGVPRSFYFEHVDPDDADVSGPNLILCGAGVSQLAAISCDAKVLEVGGAIRMGNWTIQQDGYGNLVFSSSQSTGKVIVPSS